MAKLVGTDANQVPLNGMLGSAAYMQESRFALSHQWVIKTSAYTALNRQQIAADTSGGAWTLTLPANPKEGYVVSVMDYNISWGTNTLTVNGNGSDINLGSADFERDTDLPLGFIQFVYFSGIGWRTL